MSTGARARSRARRAFSAQDVNTTLFFELRPVLPRACRAAGWFALRAVDFISRARGLLTKRRCRHGGVTSNPREAITEGMGAHEAVSTALLRIKCGRGFCAPASTKNTLRVTELVVPRLPREAIAEGRATCNLATTAWRPQAPTLEPRRSAAATCVMQNRSHRLCQHEFACVEPHQAL